MSYTTPPQPPTLSYPPRRFPSKRAASANFLRRNALLILSIGSVIAFWVALYAWLVYKPHFSSKAVVIIKDSAVTSRYVEPDKQYALQTTSSNSSNPVLNSMGLLKSSKISHALWTYLQENQAGELKKHHIRTRREWDSFFQDGAAFIKAKNQPGTDLISIQFAWSQPIIAKEGLDTIVKAFQDSSRDLNKAEEASRTKFLTRQSSELEEMLRQTRHKKSLFRSRIGTVSMTREQDDLAASRLDMANKLSQTEAQARGKESQAANYQAALGMSGRQAVEATAVGQNSTMAKLQDELYRLKQLYSVLHASLTDNNPKIREIKAQIAEVEANIRSEGGRTLAGGHRSAPGRAAVADSTRSDMISKMMAAQSEAKDLWAQATIMRNRLGEIKQEIRTYPGYAEQISDLDQKENSLSIALDQLRQKVIEARIKEEQTLSNVFIVDAPRLPEKPQFPNQIHMTLIGIMLGLGTGTAVAFGRERLLKADDPSDDDDDDHDPDHRPTGWLDSMDDDDDNLGSGKPSAGDLEHAPIRGLTGRRSRSAKAPLNMGFPVRGRRAADYMDALVAQPSSVPAPAPTQNQSLYETVVSIIKAEADKASTKPEGEATPIQNSRVRVLSKPVITPNRDLQAGLPDSRYDLDFMYPDSIPSLHIAPDLEPRQDSSSTNLWKTLQSSGDGLDASSFLATPVAAESKPKKRSGLKAIPGILKGKLVSLRPDHTVAIGIGSSVTGWRKPSSKFDFS